MAASAWSSALLSLALIAGKERENMLRKFVCEEHEEFGCNGWRPQWMPEADPLGGMAVAHDILEHFPNDDGGIVAEVQALGAALWVRGEAGYWAQYTQQHTTSPGQNIGSDFRELFSHNVGEGFRVGRPEGRAGCYVLEEHAEAEIEEAIQCGRRDMIDEAYDDDERREVRRFFDELEPARWLRIGYRKARRRYADTWYGTDELVYLFHQIETEADEALKRADVGEILYVSLHMKKGNLRTWTTYPGEEGW